MERGYDSFLLVVSRWRRTAASSRLEIGPVAIKIALFVVSEIVAHRPFIAMMFPP